MRKNRSRTWCSTLICQGIQHIQYRCYWQTSSTTPKFNKTTTGKLKRVDHYKKNESRKHERLHFERKLQSNLDQYVTRAVTELVYRIPDGTTDTGDNDEDAERMGRRGRGGGQDVTLTHEKGTGEPLGENAHATSDPRALADIMAQERFPIPMEVRKKRHTESIEQFSRCLKGVRELNLAFPV